MHDELKWLNDFKVNIYSSSHTKKQKKVQLCGEYTKQIEAPTSGSSFQGHGPYGRGAASPPILVLQILDTANPRPLQMCRSQIAPKTICTICLI